MKIGIITYSDTRDNYGQILQCYALQTYLKELGHDAFLIQYCPTEISFKDKIVIRFKLLCKLLTISKVRFYLSTERKRLIDRNNKLINQNNQLNENREFQRFKDKYISKTDCVYNSIYELRKNPPQADIYICGSDQIWRGSSLSPNTAGWFLDFGNPGITRISYAASMGGKKMESRDIKMLKKHLSKFSAISVRESTSKNSCSIAGFKDTTIVMDPTMLISLGQYQHLFSNTKINVDNKYLYLYILNVEDKDEIHYTEIEKYASSCNLGIKVVYSSGYIPARELFPNVTGLQATIPEWLAYIYNAESIITTSFHGVVFCVKMNKPFIAILLNNSHSAGNIRIINLLDSLGLGGRLYNSHISLEEQMNMPIDWSDANSKLNSLINNSCEFLGQAIKD